MLDDKVWSFKCLESKGFYAGTSLTVRDSMKVTAGDEVTSW